MLADLFQADRAVRKFKSQRTHSLIIVELKILQEKINEKVESYQPQIDELVKELIEVSTETAMNHWQDVEAEQRAKLNTLRQIKTILQARE